MTFILRWPAILALFALVAIALLGAFAITVALAHLPVDLSGSLSEQDVQTLGQSTWLDAGLLYGAGLFFLISAIRLIRKTQGFWTWLLGFACYGGHWALTQQSSGGLVATVQSIDVQSYVQPEALVSNPGAPAAQVGIIGIILIVGLFVFIADAADRAYWDRQAA